MCHVSVRVSLEKPSPSSKTTCWLIQLIRWVRQTFIVPLARLFWSPWVGSPWWGPWWHPGRSWRGRRPRWSRTRPRTGWRWGWTGCTSAAGRTRSAASAWTSPSGRGNFLKREHVMSFIITAVFNTGGWRTSKNTHTRKYQFCIFYHSPFPRCQPSQIAAASYLPRVPPPHPCASAGPCHSTPSRLKHTDVTMTSLILGLFLTLFSVCKLFM